MTRTVAEKMGIKPGSRAHFVQAPTAAWRAIDLPDLEVVGTLEGTFDYPHYFVFTQQDMRATFPTLTPHLRDGGMLWLSWPKGGRLGSNLGLPKVIKIGYDFGLVESTCLRVSDVWAGLKFTHPAHRAQCVGVELPFSHFSPFEAAPGHPRTGRVSTSAVGR